MDEKRYLVRYKSATDVLSHAVITIPEEDYRANMSYRENIQHALRDMSDNGGVWVDDKTLIPFHRVLALECYEQHDNRGNREDGGNRNNGGDKYHRRHGRRSRGLIKPSNQANSNQANSNQANSNQNGDNTTNATQVSNTTTPIQPPSNTL